MPTACIGDGLASVDELVQGYASNRFLTLTVHLWGWGLQRQPQAEGGVEGGRGCHAGGVRDEQGQPRWLAATMQTACTGGGLAPVDELLLGYAYTRFHLANCALVVRFRPFQYPDAGYCVRREHTEDECPPPPQVEVVQNVQNSLISMTRETAAR